MKTNLKSAAKFVKEIIYLALLYAILTKLVPNPDTAQNIAMFCLLMFGSFSILMENME